MATNGMLIANGTDLENIFKVSVISKTYRDFLDMACDTNKEALLTQQLDDYDYAIFDSDWKDRLRESYNGIGITHYNEFLARKRGGCEQPNSTKEHRGTCQECKDDYGYKNRPRCLLRFFRNVHAHALEKIGFIPGGFLETKLFRNGYEDKSEFVSYFMNKFPKLLHIVSAIKLNQTSWFNWSGSVPDQVLEGLTNALDFERDRGAVIQKFQCNQLDGWGKCELEVIASHGPLVSRNIGKVLRIQATILTVNHKSGEIITYSINNPGNKTFNVVLGLEQLNTINLSSSKVMLLTSIYEKIEDVSTTLKNFGEFEPVDLNWDDISKEAQDRIRKDGVIVVQTKTYQASRFRLETLSGVHLNKLLESESVELFETGNIDPEYVRRLLIVETGFERSLKEDAVNFIKLCDEDLTFQMTFKPNVQINSDSELLALDKLSVPYVVMSYDVSFTQDCIYEKILYLASGKKIRLIEYRDCTYENDNVSSTNQVIRQQDLLKEVKEKLVFITGRPGEGKTTLLKNLHRSLNIPKSVVLHMCANDLVSKFDTELPGIQAVAQCFGFNDFEKEVIGKLKVVLLVDALDEANSDLTQTINGVLKVDNVRIVVSVRNHLESELKSKFQSAKFCQLARLQERDQVSIFLTRWRKLGGSTCEATAKEFLSIYRKEFNLTPLLCHMIAEVYADPKNNIQRDTVLSKLKIYEFIVRKNFRRYLIEKKKVPEENAEDDIYQKLFMDYIRAHAFLAIKRKPLPWGILCEYLEILESQDKVELTPGQGLLESLEPPIFIHNTFAEFLQDWWVFLVLTGKIKIIKKYVPAFSEMFEKRYVLGLCAYLLEGMLEEHTHPVLFNFQKRDFDLEKIENVYWLYAYPYTLKTWVCSLKHFSAEEFEDEIVRISEICSYEIRPYFGSHRIPTVRYITKIRADCVMAWLGLGERPWELLKTFPNGFYLRHFPHCKELSLGTKPRGVLRYVPEESLYVLTEKETIVGWENYSCRVKKCTKNTNAEVYDRCLRFHDN